MKCKIFAIVAILSLCLTGCGSTNTKAEETFSQYYVNGKSCSDVTEEMLDYLQGSWYSPSDYYGDGYTAMVIEDTMSTGLGSFRPDTMRIVAIYETKDWESNEKEYSGYYKALAVDYGSGATCAISIETGKKDKIRIDGVPLQREEL